MPNLELNRAVDEIQSRRRNIERQRQQLLRQQHEERDRMLARLLDEQKAKNDRFLVQVAYSFVLCILVILVGCWMFPRPEPKPLALSWVLVPTLLDFVWQVQASGSLSSLPGYFSKNHSLWSDRDWFKQFEEVIGSIQTLGSIALDVRIERVWATPASIFKHPLALRSPNDGGRFVSERLEL